MIMYQVQYIQEKQNSEQIPQAIINKCQRKKWLKCPILEVGER